ncbi:MAG: hypothetical protein ABIH29_00005, partial [Candidatus Micrarchaeota archaeon]
SFERLKKDGSSKDLPETRRCLPLSCVPHYRCDGAYHRLPTWIDKQDKLDQKGQETGIRKFRAKDGRVLLEWMKKVNMKKPIIALKAGKYATGMAAAKTHTGNIAGSYLAYKSAFKQAGVTEAHSLDELFDFVRIFNQPLPKGNRVGIITNGGGMGILTTDAVEDEGLVMSKFSSDTAAKLKEILPSYGTVANPLDLVADAGVEAYEKAIEAYMEDPEIDALAIVVLMQTPPIDERILHILIKASDDRRKPILTISVGGEYTENYRKILEARGVPCYQSPASAIKALKRFVEYAERKRKIRKR